MQAREALEEHRQHPRHLGKLVGCDAVGDVGSIVVGDALRFFLSIDDDTVREAQFQVFGAADMIPAASVLCDMLPGKTVQEARRLQPEHICQHLGGLDRYELTAQIWALDAMHVALDTYQGLDTPVDEELDALVCRCHGVSETQLREAITEDGCDSIDKLSAMTFAGSGCGSCKTDMQRILDDVLKPDEPTTTAPQGSIEGRIPLMKKINTIVAREFEACGFELWDLAGEQVIIKFIEGGLDEGDDPTPLAGRLQQRIQDEIDPRLQVLIADQ